MTKSKKTAEFQLDKHPFFWFGQILFHRNRLLNKELRPFDLDYQRMKVLIALSEWPDCSMQRLAEITSVDRTSLTHTVQILVTRGLVKRQESLNDRRVLMLNLSAPGSKLVKQITPIVLKLNDRTMQGFALEETDAIVGQLQKMAENLKD